MSKPDVAVMCRCGGVGCFRCLCDRCGKPNDRADHSSYCTPCGADFQARVRGDPEQQPIGTFRGISGGWRRGTRGTP